MKTYATGALRSPPDPRDFRLASAAPAALPEKFMQDMPPVIDQGGVGNCVAQACCYATRAVNGIAFDPNWLYGRRGETDYQGYGWYVRLALKTLLKEGNIPATGQAALEVREVQGYIKKNLLKLLPAAKKYKIEAYAQLGSANEIKTALVNGMRVVFCTQIASFDVDPDGLFRCPTNRYGGHAMSVWGYDGDRFRVQNSWGASWGDGGRCWMLAEDVLRWNDCWAITDEPSEKIIKPKTEDKEVRYTAAIKTKAAGAAVRVRKTSASDAVQVGSIKDGSIVLVLSEHGTRREVCYANGKTYLVGWIPASYIDAAAGYNNIDEGD